LDPEDPISIGAMVGPEAFTEVRYLEHLRQMAALQLIPRIAEEFKGVFGRDSGGLVSSYRADDASLLVVAMGSVVGTLCDLVDEMRAEGVAIGVVSIRSFRPFPQAAVLEALTNADRVVVLEKSLAVGLGGMLGAHIDMSLRHVTLPIHNVIGGLGGRPITRASLREMLAKAMSGELEPLHFLDLKQGPVDRQLEEAARSRRTGGIAESILRDMGLVTVAKT
jgi:pyruvate ferredoxin oxidoreductase alpha subunit